MKMTINTHKGMTVVIGNKVNRVLNDAYEIHANAGIHSTYMLEGFNTNIVDYMYFSLRNNLDEILKETKRRKPGDTTPAIVFIQSFDRMQSVKMLNSIKHLLNEFLDSMPCPTHIYIGAETYEMCRNEQCLVSHTGDIVRFDDYEAWRNLYM